MSSIIINVSELRDVEGESVKELGAFLKKTLKAEIDVGSNEIKVKPRGEGESVPSKAYLRVLLRKFLHREELKEELRVISGGEDVLMIKVRRELRRE